MPHERHREAGDLCWILLRGADHNLSVRLAMAKGRIEPTDVTTDVDLYDSYREMAEANGVSPDDPALALCR